MSLFFKHLILSSFFKANRIYFKQCLAQKKCILYTHMVIISTKIGKRKEKKRKKGRRRKDF